MKNIIVFFSLICFVQNIAAQMTHLVSFSSNDLSLTTLLAQDNNNYTQVEFAALSSTEEIGFPDLNNS